MSVCDSAYIKRSSKGKVYPPAVFRSIYYANARLSSNYGYPLLKLLRPQIRRLYLTASRTEFSNSENI